MMRYDLNGGKIISIVKGRVRDDGVYVFTVVRNEMYIIPAFLEHYRELGVAQFLFLDDKSDDGTLEYLLNQPDCVILGSELRYGERVAGQRAAHLWKNKIPQRFLLGKWAICADADEFLFIPPEFDDIHAFVEALDRRGTTAVAAQMVDFYPATLRDLENAAPPRNKDELLSSFPWFDAGPYCRWTTSDPSPVVLHGGVRERLLQKYGISKREISKSGFKRLMSKIKRVTIGDRNIKSIVKVPLVKWDESKEYSHSHALNQMPDRSIMLPLAHFKFTGFLEQKIDMAIASRAHAGGSRAYFAYAKLVEAMRKGDGSFLCPRSVKFTGVQDFIANGLMKFDASV